jgi:1,4-dihydroxy-2-naphthoyl-CoA synthase
MAIELMAAGALIPDAQEGFAAFLEKRKPEFRSRPTHD